MELPSLAALATLEAIARLGSVTAAARALHLTQSAVSHRLRALERETGLQLVEHIGRGLRLTPAALRLSRAATEARQLLQDTLTSLAREPTRAVLSVSCSPSFAIRFLVPHMAAFRTAHPELDVRVAADDVAVDPVRAGTDLSVRLTAGPESRLYSEKLVDEIVFPVASPHLLARLPLREAGDLARHTLLHDDAFASHPSRVGWGDYLDKVGARKVDRDAGPRFSHAYLALESALAGDGVALSRRTLAAEDLRRGRLVAPLRESVSSGLTYWLSSAVDPSRKAALSLLRDYLRTSLLEAQRVADRARRGKTSPSRTNTARRAARGHSGT
jgi:LysR family glycine cleavage system transcriptional activator